MAEVASAADHPLPRDTLLVRGPDRKSWLDGLLTCGVADVAPGKAAYGLLLTKQGKIVSDVFLAETGHELFVGVAPGHGAEVRELLDRYLVMEDAELTTPSEAVTWYLTYPVGGAPGGEALARGALSMGSLAAELTVSKGKGSAKPDQAQPVLAALLAAHGLGVFGVDFGQRDNPHEAALDRVAVSWTKGCYLGQEVVCMQDMRGKVKRRLVALDAESALPGLVQAADSPGPEVVDAAGAVVGHVTSQHQAAGGGARLLASLSSAVLESPGALSVRGSPVRVVQGTEPKLG
jgi:tRNA-modifying protein YgfZ